MITYVTIPHPAGPAVNKKCVAKVDTDDCSVKSFAIVGKNHKRSEYDGDLFDKMLDELGFDVPEARMQIEERVEFLLKEETV